MKVNDPENEDDEKNVYISSKERVDSYRVEVEKLEQLRLILEKPETAILLLTSSEDPVVLKVLHHLDKYVSKSPDNARVIYNMGISEPLLNVNSFSDTLFVQRFAMKIISEFMILEEAKKELIKNKVCSDLFYDTFMNTTDDYLLEYSALVLGHLSDEPRILKCLYQDGFLLERIFDVIKQTVDPDVKCNCLKMLYNTMQDPLGLDEITQRSDFPFDEINICVKSQFSEIQLLALRILEILTIDPQFLDKFMEESFSLTLHEILANDELMNLHEAVCAIFKKLYCIGSYYDAYGIPEFFGKFLNYINKHEIDQKEYALSVIVAILKHETPKSKNTLEYFLNQGIVEILTNMLPQKKSLDCCQGIKEATKLPQGIALVLKENPIPNLLNIIDEALIKPEVKIAAADDINIILINDMVRSAELVIAGRDVFINMLLAPFGEVPLNTLLSMIKIMITMSEFPEIRCRFMNEDFSECLVNAFKDSFLSTRLVIEYLNLICIYLNCPTIQTSLMNADISKLIIQCLDSLSSTLKGKAADFIILSSRIPKFCEEYIENGVLNYLLTSKDLAIYCAKCSIATESILSMNLPVKFAVRSFLNTTDKIGNYFYASRNKWTDYMTLREIMKSTDIMSPRYSIYLVDIPERGEDGESPSNESLNSMFPMQMHLTEIIKELQESVPETATRLDKIELLVGKLNKHFEGSGKENEHELVVHLNELKEALASNVIPLEYLRKGGSFERALLFKVLGEQIEIWSTLHLTQFGAAWNEITFEPNEYCKVTHVVDVFRPGKYYRIGSIDAREYVAQCA